jgi:DNA-binding NtrC family response regulator
MSYYIRMVNKERNNLLTRRVAFVDDDVDIVESFSEILRDYYDVTIFNSSQKFLEQVSQAETCPFDVVLTDLNMPGLSGLEMMKAFNRLGFEVPAVAFSGYLSKESCIELNKCGVYRLVEKPATLNVLLESLDEVLQLHHRKLKLDHVIKTVHRLKEAFDASQLLGSSSVPDDHLLNKSFEQLDNIVNGLLSDVQKLSAEESLFQQMMLANKMK